MGRRATSVGRGRWVAWVAVVLIAEACTGGGQPPHTSIAPKPSSSPSRLGSCHGCGSVILIGATGWPECLNPLIGCSGSPWYRYMVQALVFPRLVQYSNTMQPEASPLIRELPSLDNGGISLDPFTVTFHLNPEAVWHDGTPITCDDVAFTWKAMNNTISSYSEHAYSPADGVAGISNVACPKALTVE